MSYLIDTHCHLHDREFFSAEQAEEMLARAREKNVQQIICIGTNHEDSLAAAEFASTHDNVYWTYGIHPEYADAESITPRDSRSLERSGIHLSGASAAPRARGEGRSPRNDGRERPRLPRGVFRSPVGIGEVGLDYHYPGYDRTAQIHLLEQMLQLAADHDLPVSFHVREAYADFFPVVANFPTIRGVVHSFTDNKKTLKRILAETDFYVGVNGLATYSTLPIPPLERILLETDAPFLTPEPFRGIINEPAYVQAVATWLSHHLGLPYETIEEETTKNATKLFGIQSPIFCRATDV